MAWRMEGDYIASCSCNVVCPCPFDGIPTDPNGKGECRGVAVFHVESGNLDDTDVSGVNFALVNFFPANISAGNWKLGVVVDDGASEAQTAAVGKILSGEVGGPFADFAPLVGENLGLERAKVGFTADRGSIGGMSDFTWEPFLGADGSPSTVKIGALAFAPEFAIGRTKGKNNALGMEFDSNYGESAHFSYSSEGHEHLRA
jgi:hypothetical protein